MFFTSCKYQVIKFFLQYQHLCGLRYDVQRAGSGKREFRILKILPPNFILLMPNSSMNPRPKPLGLPLSSNFRIHPQVLRMYVRNRRLHLAMRRADPHKLQTATSLNVQVKSFTHSSDITYVIKDVTTVPSLRRSLRKPAPWQPTASKRIAASFSRNCFYPLVRRYISDTNFQYSCQATTLLYSSGR